MSHKSIRHLLIENFQSHEKTELAFDDGLNVVVGASDVGKSAVIRALRWVLYNEPRGADFIRVGSSQCRVTLELSDGSRVTRERTPSKNRYIVVQPDGHEQIYEGFGNSVPKEVSDATGVAKVLLDEDTETTLHLGTQLEPPFMLSEPGSIKAKAIGRLNGVHIIDAASRDTHRDLTRLASEEKALREQLLEVETELQQYDELDYMETMVLLLEEKQALLKQMIARHQRLQALREKQEAVAREIAAATEVIERTAGLDRAALLAEQAVTLQSKELRLRQTQTKLQQVDTALTATEQILDATALLDRAGEQLEAGEARLQRFTRLSRLQAERDKQATLAERIEAVLTRTQGLDTAAQHLLHLDGAKQRAESLRRLRLKHAETVTLLERIDKVLVRTDHVEAGLTSIGQLEQLRSKVLHLRDAAQRKQEVDRQLHTVQNVLTALHRTERVEEALQHLQRLTERQQRLHAMQQALVDVTDRLGKADEYLEQNGRDLARMLDQYSEALKQSGSCPVCFAPIDEHTTERLLEEFRGGQD